MNRAHKQTENNSKITNIESEGMGRGGAANITRTTPRR